MISSSAKLLVDRAADTFLTHPPRNLESTASQHTNGCRSPVSTNAKTPGQPVRVNRGKTEVLMIPVQAINPFSRLSLRVLALVHEHLEQLRVLLLHLGDCRECCGGLSAGLSQLVCNG